MRALVRGGRNQESDHCVDGQSALQGLNALACINGWRLPRIGRSKPQIRGWRAGLSSAQLMSAFDSFLPLAKQQLSRHCGFPLAAEPLRSRLEVQVQGLNFRVSHVAKIVSCYRTHELELTAARRDAGSHQLPECGQ